MSRRVRALLTAQLLILSHECTWDLSRAVLLDTSGSCIYEGLVVAQTSNVNARKERANEGRRSSGSGKVTHANQYSHFQDP